MSETVELPPPLNDGYDQPTVIDDVLFAFPGHLDRLLPEWDDIPDDFKNPRNEWCVFVHDWFFNGWPEDRDLFSREDVEPEMAYRHLPTILMSYEPKHEHKMAGVAWLMSRWYAALRPKA